MDYKTLQKNIKKIDKKYRVKTLGKTEFNRKIYAVEKTNDSSFSTAILVASVHAREWIATDLMFEFLKNNVFDGITKFNVSLVLMANPDGAELAQNGIKNFPKRHREFLIEANGKNLDFSLWKANALGVDINNNFDAMFGKHAPNKKPFSQGYAGRFAESEKETKVLLRYIECVDPFIVICYHTKGEEIYYNFFQENWRLERDRAIAEKFASSTGYSIKNVEAVSSGGLKDYVVQTLKIPSLTIECGSDDLCHPITDVKDIFLRNKNIANDLEFAYNEFIKYQGK